MRDQPARANRPARNIVAIAAAFRESTPCRGGETGRGRPPLRSLTRFVGALRPVFPKAYRDRAPLAPRVTVRWLHPPGLTGATVAKTDIKRMGSAATTARQCLRTRATAPGEPPPGCPAGRTREPAVAAVFNGDDDVFEPVGFQVCLNGPNTDPRSKRLRDRLAVFEVDEDGDMAFGRLGRTERANYRPVPRELASPDAGPVCLPRSGTSARGH